MSVTKPLWLSLTSIVWANFFYFFCIFQNLFFYVLQKSYRFEMTWWQHFQCLGELSLQVHQFQLKWLVQRSETISENVAFVFLQNQNVWSLAFVFLQNVIQHDLKCSKDKLLLLEHDLDLVHNVHIVCITHLHAIWLVLLKYYKEFKYDFISSQCFF